MINYNCYIIFPMEGNSLVNCIVKVIRNVKYMSIYCNVYVNCPSRDSTIKNT